MNEPRFKKGDEVQLQVVDEVQIGIIRNVHRYGSVGHGSYGKCPSYDILVGDEADLSKCFWHTHVPEANLA